jgi:hypothetical protein
MALIHIDLTLTGSAQLVYSTRKGIRQLIIQNPTGNSAVYVGTATVSASRYGQTVAAGSASSVLGPFSGDAPVNTSEVYVSGTQGNVIHALMVTH